MLLGTHIHVVTRLLPLVFLLGRASMLLLRVDPLLSILEGREPASFRFIECAATTHGRVSYSAHYQVSLREDHCMWEFEPRPKRGGRHWTPA